MRRFLLIIAAVAFALTLLFFNVPEISRAQTPRTDTIRFMAATRGTNFDGTGLKWCVSQTWHRGIPNSNLADALDEVPQTATGCPSLSTEQVELLAYGLTDDTSCTLSAPCESLRVEITSGVATGECNYIAAALYDFSTVNDNPNGASGELKGTQRMLHSRGSSGYRFSIRVTSGVYYSGQDNWRMLGTVVDDVNCMTQANPPQPGFTPGQYHVHQDFVPPTLSGSCRWNMSASPFPTGATDQRRDDPVAWYIYSLQHIRGLSCFSEGPKKVADNLLAPDGALDGDGNGAGTRALATGAQPSVTSAPTCITGTSWCGTMTATPPVLVGAFDYYLGLSPVDYFRGQQKSFPPPGVDRYWYGPDSQGYYFEVRYDSNFPFGSGQYGCQYISYGEPMYRLDVVSTAVLDTACGLSYTEGFGNATFTGAMAQQFFANFRGVNGTNPAAPPTQQDANTWAQTQIDSGHWWDVVQPALDAVIRAAAGNMDMATLGIAGDPPFDGALGDVGMAGVMNRPNTLASRGAGPHSSDRARDEVNSGWIRSTRLTRPLTRERLR